MTVVDASAILEILAKTDVGLKLEATLDADLHAPHLIDLEVANVIRRWELSGVVDATDASRFLDTFRAMEIERHEHSALLDEIWALRKNLTAYDASYLALARFLGAELLTMDAGLRKMSARWIH